MVHLSYSCMLKNRDLSKQDIVAGVITGNILYIILTVAILLIGSLFLQTLTSDWTVNILNQVWSVWLIIGGVLAIIDIGAILRFLAYRLQRWLHNFN